jgi:hypothetical protein
LFGFTAAASLVANDACVTGSPQVGVTDGYYAFIEPLPPGMHVLQLQSSGTVFGSGVVTIHLTVR